MPTVMNAANEVAVADFLADKTGFLDIADRVERTMSDYKNIPNPTIEDLLTVDAEIRARANRR